MHRFYADEAPTGELAPLSPEDVRHAQRVLRMQPGDAMELLFDGRRFAGVLAGMPNGELGCRITGELPTTEPALQITLYQGLPKAEKMDWIVQKAVELGASRVVPVSMRRCVVQLDARDGTRKQERWQKIAREAAKQSGRGVIPTVGFLPDLAEAFNKANTAALPLFMYETGERETLRDAVESAGNVASAAILTGPEGGFEPFEAELARIMKLHICSMGPRIFRCETAPVAALSALMYATGNM